MCTDSRYTMLDFPNGPPSHLAVHPRPPRVNPENPERKTEAMTTKTENKATSAHGLAPRKTLADVLAAVERNTALSPTRDCAICARQ